MAPSWPVGRGPRAVLRAKSRRPRVVGVSRATQDRDKADLIGRTIELARTGRGSGGPPRDAVDGLLRAYYRHVAPEDVLDRTEADLYGAFASHYRLAGDRPQGRAAVRVTTPTVAEHGWSAAGRSVVEVVVDDMPFLVDSLTMELSRQLRDVYVVIHPLFDVVRDVAGALRSVSPVEDGVREPAEGAVRESWMHVEIERVADDGDVAALEEDIQRVLEDVREAVEDWSKMHARIREIVAELDERPPPLDPEEVRQARDLLTWLSEEHFTFLGYREYHLEERDGHDHLRADPGTGLGILRFDPPQAEDSGRLPEKVSAKAREKTLLVLAKANSRSTVHRPAYLDYVGVKTFDAAGEVVGERRFLGLFSSAAYTESLMRIPLAREKAAAVLARSGFDSRSHAGKALLDTLETYPRDELFHTPVEELAPVAEAAMQARERRGLRVFARVDTYGRYVSVLVYLPRDRYNTAVRERFAAILVEQLGGESVEFTVRIDESTTARVHFVVHLPAEARGGLGVDRLEVADLERRLTEASRSWRDDVAAAVLAEHGEEAGTALVRRYVGSFPAAYQEDFDARTAAIDVGRLEAICGEEGIDLALHEVPDAGRGEVRLKIYRVGEPLSLSTVLPTLSSLGVEVVDERPYELTGLGRRSFIYEFGLRHGGDLPDRARELVQDAVRAVWDGYSETDGFNALVLAAGLSWRQASVLRAYARYMRQGGSPFALSSLAAALVANVDITRLLAELFEVRFDPAYDAEAAGSDRDVRQGELRARVLRALDDVASLDHDRILRSYLAHIGATLRTNHFRPEGDEPGGAPRRYLSLKLDPSQVPDLPAPRPKFEIFVHSPRVEGVHLRFGSVARGGLRWSDRRDDFRTEVLGLVKAQMVKNTVIVPVGAKGGFYCKQLPAPGDRDAWLAEGQECYRTFIRGLLDVTDNLVDGETVPAPYVVRHDEDDTYLVVAADKGTATFSDIANGVAADYDFWLGDAFASGGSVGYDHKAMGITARGAWVSVQRHFRERGIDCQAEDFTAVGIGDMSGDVFGNGMLRSEHTRLVAAFDHRDIFLDPDPDAATSFAERQRLFELPRSSWRDYDTSLISEGGGVWSRSAKSVPVSAQVRRALGLPDDVERLTPNELIRAILRAPVDLLWNGGIGTYVKASDEPHTAAGDKANDAIRVDGRDLRARCVGEGGNLGLTQAGRIEYARSGVGGEGGRINTDFIDNSAGVDTSDHEVNIKILLDRVVRAGDLTTKQRNAVLAEMTDEVAELVLRDNYEQNLALANAAANATSLLHVHEEWMRRLEEDGVLDREVEGLPSRAEVRRRLERREGLTVPELSVLLSWTKIVLADRLLASDLPDDPYLELDLRTYFPQPVREGFGPQVESHPLRREIIVTQVVNDLVNGAGMTFVPRLSGETGADVADLTRANFVAREIFASLPLRLELMGYDNRLDARVQTRMRIEMRTLVERATRWLIAHRRPPLDSRATVEEFRGPVQAVVGRLPELMTGRELTAWEERRDRLVRDGVPEDLAERVAVLSPAYAVLGIVETAAREGLDAAEVARVHFTLGERLGLSAVVQRIAALPRQDRWQTMARAALREDLHSVHAQLTRQVLRSTSADDPAPMRVAAWEETDGVVVGRAAATLEEICADDADLARLSVALRVVRGLLT
ncbi:NAD-glutamate dehydrogenase [Nocardioides sp. zg-579]|uniref:NAD-glutamate dehydrogenase n=1 Tax=Nocardioides marmotae TaxID=2663857 RepID=A0A6I3IYZ7_9ACTN|nr:NAD-glutamate dehydrogenase [Gordonia jinghuaiqii]MTB94297.1 NAD-glutamate dehydrogenase [Nocardioides marmotae]QKE00572.1 NAD-glutamate dehydrogenase [Nocardioides marmotae]